jgi:rhodanese-related sulfurtransferase
MDFFRNVIGGIAIMVVATVIGIAVNTVHGNSVKLIPKMTSPPPVPVPTDQMPRAGTEAIGSPEITAEEYAAGEVSKERLREIMSSPLTVILDARGHGEYEEGHLPGAVSLPYDEFMNHYAEVIDKVPMDSPIVCYCRSVTCDLSDQLARELRLMGYEKVVLYRGGWDEWTEAGYPTVGGEAE